MEDDDDDGSSLSESISVRSAANMFGGQAVIRRIPTPSSQRRNPTTSPSLAKRPTPPKVPTKPLVKPKPQFGARNPGAGFNDGVSNDLGAIYVQNRDIKENGGITHGCGEENNNVEDEKMVKGFPFKNISENKDLDSGLNQDKDMETDADVLDKPLESLSEINGISDDDETYDNVDDNENIPSYEQFISGTGNLVDDDSDEDDVDVENVQIPDNIEAVENCKNVLPQSVKKLVEFASMDYTVLGTISPLNDISNNNNSQKEELSLVLGCHAKAETSDSSGRDNVLVKGLSPQSRRPPLPVTAKRKVMGVHGYKLKPVADVPPTPRNQGQNHGQIYSFASVPGQQPRSQGSASRSLPSGQGHAVRGQGQRSNQLGIMCEGCNNCLLDFKRQALRLLHSENSTEPVALVGSLEISNVNVML